VDCAGLMGSELTKKSTVLCIHVWLVRSVAHVDFDLRLSPFDVLGSLCSQRLPSIHHQLRSD
jgi:hypothetical protein